MPRATNRSRVNPITVQCKVGKWFLPRQAVEVSGRLDYSFCNTGLWSRSPSNFGYWNRRQKRL